MSEPISRLSELKTQATQACMNAMTTNQQSVYAEGVKTLLELDDMRTDDGNANVITQQSVWREEDSQFRYSVIVAVFVEREQI